MGNQNSGKTENPQEENITISAVIQEEKVTPYKKRFQYTPTDILKSNLEKCPTDREPLLFLTVGSLCPIHIQHVQIQEIAKQYLEVFIVLKFDWIRFTNVQENFPVQVVGGIIATAHDHYVMSKYRHAGRMESFIAWDERIRLIGLYIFIFVFCN